MPDTIPAPRYSKLKRDILKILPGAGLTIAQLSKRLGSTHSSRDIYGALSALIEDGVITKLPHTWPVVYAPAEVD